MQASFVICFHSARLDNLLQTLRFLDNKHELITVCQDNFNFQTSWKHHKHFNMNLNEMSLPKLTNFGVEQATNDKIVVLESDRILPNNYFDKVFEQLRPGIQITTKTMKKLKKPISDEDILNENYDFRWENRSEINLLGVRNTWSGNTAFMKDDFLKSGKMDETYVGYGWADHDMTASMEKIGIKTLFLDDIELHLWHESLTYGQKDQKNLFFQNAVYFCRKWNQPLPEFIKQEMRQHMLL